MQKVNGFTILELLISISIISILAALSIANFKEYKMRAYAVAVVHDLKNIHTSLLAYVDYTGSPVWPYETTVPGGGSGHPSPKFQSMANVTSAFGKFMRVVPRAQGTTDPDYYFDSDANDVYNPAICSPLTGGVNIVLYGVPSEMYSYIDRAIDGNNDLNCGRLRVFTPTGQLFYSMGDGPKDL